MARITVEDCIDKFPSRFELVLIASNRARKLYSGDQSTVDKDNDKNTVIALREIAKETLSKEKLQSDLIEEYQTATFSEEEDLSEELSIEQDTTENNDPSVNSYENENNNSLESSDEKLDESSDEKLDESFDSQELKDNEQQNDVNDSKDTEDLNQEDTENNN